MTDAGRRQVAIAKSDGTWTILDGPEALIVPDDLAAALDERRLRDAWDALSPSVRRAALTKLALTKRPETRARHVERIAGNREKMPQKSTYFYPKVLTGVVFNSLKKD